MENIPDWVIPDHYHSLRGKIEYATYDLLPNPDSLTSAFEHISSLSNKTDAPLVPQKLIGYNGRFEETNKILKEWGCDSKINVLEFKVHGMESKEQVDAFFKIFVSIFVPHFDELLKANEESNEGEEYIQKSGLDLKSRCAEALPQSLVEGANIPEDLKWFVEGTKAELIPDPCWKEALDCDRDVWRRNFVFLLELAGIHTIGDDQDRAGSHSFDETKKKWYPEKEQRRWRNCYCLFRPDPKNASFGYCFSSPNDLRDLAHSLRIPVEQDLYGDNPKNKCWTSSSGSGGGSLYQSNSGYYRMYEDYNIRKEDRKEVVMNWNHVYRVRDAIKRFIRETKESGNQLWKNDKFNGIIAVRSVSMAELDLKLNKMSSMMNNDPLLKEFADRNLIEVRCWFATDFPENISLDSIHKGTENLKGLQISFKGNARFPLKDLSSYRLDQLEEMKNKLESLELQREKKQAQQEEDSRTREKQREREMEEAVANHELTEEQCEEIEELWQTDREEERWRMNKERFLPPKPGNRLYEKEVQEFSYPFIISIGRIQPHRVEDDEVKPPLHYYQLGCFGCCNVRYFRPGIYGSENTICNSMCSLHKSLLLGGDIEGLPSFEGISEVNFFSTCHLPRGSANDTMKGFINPDRFFDFFGLKCGELRNKLSCWPEKNLNELIATGSNGE
eukprot:TRINITY_DN6901_c0_g1_i1.p1 TRINITY_DN6901_c0_g1~~TRINITY_DN6901_c0_g1_i1.p1  ORF type:complete len:673 (-),score=149.56 TRINITY_DN6901_c0_g1_i1:38-2056(-)